MRILLGTYSLRRRGGTEMWTKTMYDQLALDHEVDVATVQGNSLWPELPRFKPRRTYDLAIVNHNLTIRRLRHARVRRVIMVSHGIVPWLEWPVLGADAYVSVSAEVQQFLPIQSTVILNPIDTQTFAPSRAISSQPGRVAMLSNYTTPAFRLLHEACEELGAEIRTAGDELGGGSDPNPAELMNWADLVVGVGRVALEGMATGRNVFSLGPTGAGGMITPDNVERFADSNFKPQSAGSWLTTKELAADIQTGYDAGRDLRQYVIDHHSPPKIAHQFLELAESLSRRRRIATRAVRLGPKSLMSARTMTLIDPFLREIQGRRSSDGRPGVLGG